MGLLTADKKYPVELSFINAGAVTFGVNANVIPAALGDAAVTIASKTSFGDIGVVAQTKFTGAFKGPEFRGLVTAPVGAGASLQVDAGYKGGASSMGAGLKYKWDGAGTVYAKTDSAGNVSTSLTTTLGPLSTLTLSSVAGSSVAWSLELSA